MTTLINAINNEPFIDGRLAVLKKTLAQSALGYDAAGVVAICNAFTFSGEKTQAIQFLQPYVLGKCGGTCHAHGAPGCVACARKSSP